MQSMNPADVKGKGKLTAADYDAAFASFDQGLHSKAAALHADITALEESFKKADISDELVAGTDMDTGRLNPEMGEFER